MSIVQDAFGQGRMTSQTKAVLWPACACGCPWPAHKCPCTHDGGYIPSRPVVDLGTRAYQPSQTLPWWTRVGCAVAWAIEFRLQGWRERHDPRT